MALIISCEAKCQRSVVLVSVAAAAAAECPSTKDAWCQVEKIMQKFNLPSTLIDCTKFSAQFSTVFYPQQSSNSA